VKRYEGMVPIAGRRCGTIWPAVSRRERHEKLVRAEGLEPSRTLRSNGFSCHYGFRRPRLIASKVWGLDYPFAMPQISFGIRRCPSSLYTFPTGTPIAPAGLARDRHATGFPDFEQFYHRRFPGGHSSFRLSPVRLPIPPRPHGFKDSTKRRLTRSDF
jgi:hypothetical protein